MRIPSHMKIGEDIYSVKVDKKLKEDASNNVEIKSIKINERVLASPITNILTTVFHECNHGISDHFGFTFMINNRHHAKLAEDVIEAASRGLVMLMVDNTEFFEEAISEIKKEKEKWEKGNQKIRKARRKK